MSYLHQPTVDEKDIQTLGQIQDQFGFVPNFYRPRSCGPT